MRNFKIQLTTLFLFSSIYLFGQINVSCGGAVGIGGINPGYTLHVNGETAIEGAGVFKTDVIIYGTGFYSNGTYISSDEKLKKNIKVYNTNILSRVSNLNGYTYQYKDSFQYAKSQSISSKDSIPTVAKMSKKSNSKQRIGLIANEVKNEFPELVIVTKDSLLYVDYNGMIPILLEAIKELNRHNITTDSISNQKDIIIDQLKTRLDIVERKFAVCCDNSKQKSVIETNNSVSPILTCSLSQNTPNPFSQQTTISFTIADDVNKATLYVYDMQGNQKKSYPISTRGQSSLTIKGYELAPGMYMYTLITDGKEVDTKRMIITD